MNSIIRFAIIFSIFAFGNCKDEGNGNNNNNNKVKRYLTVPIRVWREPPDTVEFQFSKTVQIEPISLKANEVNFRLTEENNVKKFRNTTPLQQQPSQVIKINLEYLEPQGAERKTQTFMHSFKENLDEIITVRIEIPLPNSRPQTENPMENNGEEAFISPIRPTTESNVEKPKQLSEVLNDDFENSCENDDGYADKLLETALRHSKIGTRLLLKGLEDNSLNPVDAISEILASKLELPQLEFKILQAKFIEEGLLFEMESLRDVVEILNKQDSLKLQGLQIESTTKNFFDFSLDVRSETSHIEPTMQNIFDFSLDVKSEA